MDFIQARIANASPDAPLQIMFGIRGETELEEVGWQQLRCRGRQYS